MKDIPVFVTENGAASLILKEIPYRAAAYIHLQDTQNPVKLVDECVSFCKAVGAEHIYVTYNGCLEGYEVYTEVWRMQRSSEGLEPSVATLSPVNSQTVSKWRCTYNEAMANVPNAAYMSEADASDMVRQGRGYFVHQGERLLGIGMAAGDQLLAVASIVPGMGREIVLAMAGVLTGEYIHLEVASVNHRAIRLYTSLGFEKTKTISRWYKIV